MRNFFKKKSKSIEEYLDFLVQKPKINFQIDIIRNDLVEIQITRQRLLKKFGFNILNPDGFSISLSFDKKNEIDYQRFLKSNSFENAIHFEKLGKTYFLLCKNNLKDILNLLNEIQVSVYDYNQDTIYGFKYIKHK